MDYITYQKIDSILHGALDIPLSERDTFLAQACGGDADLREMIERMLKHSETVDHPLESSITASHPIWNDIATQSYISQELTAGDRIDVYRIIKKIGRGGMASVYLAERDDGAYRQSVAIKLLDVTRYKVELVQRFQQERQILATLDHSNIARLIGGGVTTSQQPYLVMEYIEGTTITHYCNENELTIKERVAIFIQVAHAIQYAHSHLIIHRDIKPTNILITSAGTVKLLDFGIAKLLQGSEDKDAPETQSSLRPMTPEYASPEQLSGQALTTASDIYQLGALLFQLLTGTMVFALTGKDASLVNHIVNEQDPTKPSVRVRQMGKGENNGKFAAILSERKVNKKQLVKALMGDLDTICLKALQLSPNRRYPTAKAFEEDLQNYQQKKPISARNDSAFYKARKFCSRHSIGVAMSVVILLGSTSGIIYHTHTVTAERNIAVIEAAKANEISEFMADLFRASNPNVTRDKLTARDLLDGGLTKIREDLSEQPTLQVPLLTTIAGAYKGLGFYDEALSVVEFASKQSEDIFDDNDEGRLRICEQKGSLLGLMGKYVESETVLSDCVKLSEAALGKTHPITLDALNTLGLSVWRQSRFSEAEIIFQAAIERKKSVDSDSEFLPALLNNLANVYLMQEEYEKAAPIHLQALQLSTALNGIDHPFTMDAMNNYAYDNMQMGEFKIAEYGFRQVIELRKKALGPTHPRVFSSLQKLGNLLTEMERYQEAEAVYAEAVSIGTQELGEDHPDVLWARNGLGQVAFKLGDLDRAESIFTEIFELTLAANGEDHFDTITFKYLLGELAAERGDFDKAELLFMQVASGFSQLIGADSEQAIYPYFSLVDLYIRQNRLDTAKKILDNISVSQASSKKLRADYFKTNFYYLKAVGQSEDAKESAQQSLALYQELYGDDYSIVVELRGAIEQ